MELIRKQTVLNMLDDMQFERYHTHAELELMARIYHVVNDLDSVDAVEVVRCMDCKYRYDNGRCYVSNKKPIEVCTIRYVKDNEFCSYGERKTDG